MTIEIIVALIAATLGSGVLSALITVWAGRSLTAVEVESVQVTSITGALEASERRVKFLESQITHQDRTILDKDQRIMDLTERVNQLKDQVKGMAETLEAMDTELDTLRGLIGGPGGPT